MRIRTKNSVAKSVQISSDKLDSTIEPRPAGSETQIKLPNSQRIGGSILSLGTGEIVARGAAFLGTAYAARMLGPEQFGVVGFAIAIASYFTIVVAGGFNDIGSREVARRPSEASSIAANVVAIRLVIAFIALIVLAVTAWFLNKPPTVKLVLLLMGLSFLPLAFDVSWVYKGLERNRRVAFSLIVSQLLYTGAILLLVTKPDDVAFVPLAQLLGDICMALILLGPIFSLGKIKLNLREGYNIFRNSSFWAASRVLRTLMFTFDVVLIGFLLGEQAVGLYAAPYRICFLLVALAVAIYTSYLPIMTRAALSESPSLEVGRIAERTAYFAASAAAPLVVGGIIISEPLLETIFGREYVEGSSAFRFLILSVGFVFLFGAIHNIFLVFNRLGAEMLIFAAAAAINVGLNILVVPRYGITGAAVVTALAEFITLLCGLIVVNRIGVSFSLLSIWRPVLAAVAMGAILIALGANRGLFVYLGVGCVSYLLALVLLRGVPDDALPFFQIPVALVNRLRKSPG